MPDDYLRTLDAMRDSARALEGIGHHRNACYLSGYVVECCAKLMLRQAPVPGPLDHHDLESLSQQFQAAMLLAGFGLARYGDPARLAPTMIAQVGPSRMTRRGQRHSCHWDPFHRYDGVRWTGPVARTYVAEAEAVYDLVALLAIDGVI